MSSFDIVIKELGDLKSSKTYFGRPHRRVPYALLLYEERKSWFPFGECFLVMKNGMSHKLFVKLLQIQAQRNFSQASDCESQENRNKLLAERVSLLQTNIGSLNTKKNKKFKPAMDGYKKS